MQRLAPACNTISSPAIPNITAIDGREIIARIQKVIDNAVLGISVVGGIALLSGVLILIGAVAMTKFQRVYEAAILRTLGAGTRLLTSTLALDTAPSGLLAGTIGAAGALGLSWGVRVTCSTSRGAPRQVFDHRRAVDDGAGVRHRRALERGGIAEKTARDAQGRVSALHAAGRGCVR